MYEVHPYAALFPMLCDAELKQLADDIRKNGLEEPGMLYEGKILDGRNRARACELADVQMEWCDASMSEHPEDFDALAFVLSRNLHRRHLNESQRATVAAKVANLKEGRPSAETSAIAPVSQGQAAELLNVSRDSVKRAKHAIDKGAPEVVAAMERGEIAASAAAKLVDAVPDKKQQAAIVKQGKQAVVEAVKPAAKKTLDTPRKGECIKGGEHQWTTSTDETEYCSKCYEDRYPQKPAKVEPEGIMSKFMRLVWMDASKQERAILMTWFREMDAADATQ